MMLKILSISPKISKIIQIYTNSFSKIVPIFCWKTDKISKEKKSTAYEAK
jgi:hypothetical protein